MTYHEWGDEGVDWRGIEDAADWIGSQLSRWGWISVTDTKEKYGTVRVYCTFGWDELHNVIYPRRHYIQWKRGGLMWHLNYSSIIRGLVGTVGRVVVPYQRWLYRFVYALALRKWKHLAGEILMGADYMELLVGLDPRLVREQTGEHCWTIRWEESRK